MRDKCLTTLSLQSPTLSCVPLLFLCSVLTLSAVSHFSLSATSPTLSCVPLLFLCSVPLFLCSGPLFSLCFELNLSAVSQPSLCSVPPLFLQCRSWQYVPPLSLQSVIHPSLCTASHVPLSAVRPTLLSLQCLIPLSMCTVPPLYPQCPTSLPLQLVQPASPCKLSHPSLHCPTSLLCSVPSSLLSSVSQSSFCSVPPILHCCVPSLSLHSVPLSPFIMSRSSLSIVPFISLQCPRSISFSVSHPSRSCDSLVRLVSPLSSVTLFFQIQVPFFKLVFILYACVPYLSIVNCLPATHFSVQCSSFHLYCPTYIISFFVLFL